MPLKLIRLSGSLADESFPVIRLFHVFFQNRKLYRSDVQNPAVKFFQVEIISKSFLTDCFQVKEIQISPIVFQIVTGSFHNILIDFGSSGSIGGAVCECLSEKAPVPVKRIGVNDVFGESGPATALLEKYGLDAEGIYKQIKEFV